LARCEAVTPIADVDDEPMSVKDGVRSSRSWIMLVTWPSIAASACPQSAALRMSASSV
jgi:hypothetical protein